MTLKSVLVLALVSISLGSGWAEKVDKGCPVGQYPGITQCLDCPPGTHNPADANTEMCALCLPGYVCDKPALKIPLELCPVNYFCPEGTVIPKPCPVGSNSTIGSSDVADCIIEPEDEYLNNGTDTCVAGQFSDGQSCQPCPRGTYQSVKTLTSDPTLCETCDAGRYCSKPGLKAHEGNCAAGYYCPQGSTSEKSVFCPMNYYCEQGKSAPTKCPDGYYSFPGSVGSAACKTKDSTNCQPGQYWSSGCKNCPIGTFQPSYAHGRSVDICQACPIGHYCASTGLAAPTGRCTSAGYYCPMRSTTQSQAPCPKDFYCPTNSTSTEPIPCPGATESNPGATSIAKCDAVPSVRCPHGMFINGTSCIDCPKGTYLPADKAGQPCITCDPGSYCMYPKATAVSGYCSARYYCPRGSTHPTSVMCPADHFCPSGASAPTPCPNGTNSLAGSLKNTDCSVAAKNCPPGTYTNSQACSPCPAGTYNPGWTMGNSILQVCKQCTSGKYCYGPGLTAPKGLCAPGFYCPTGSSTRVHTMCPSSHYCPVGSSLPIACPSGTAAIPGSTTKHECKTNDTVCGAGYYKQDDNCIPCPPGTYKGTPANEQCRDCPPGKYCSRQANTKPTGNCDAGYYCPGASDHPRQHLCPKDHYCRAACDIPTKCPTGKRSYAGSTGSGACTSGVPNVCSEGYYWYNNKCDGCPVGTYNPKEGRHSYEACIPCPEGKYCRNKGAERPTGDCEAGYFCPLASSSPGAIICPEGHYCPAASPGPTPCPVGTMTLPGAIDPQSCA